MNLRILIKVQNSKHVIISLFTLQWPCLLLFNKWYGNEIKRAYTKLFQIEYHRTLSIIKDSVFYNKMMSIRFVISQFISFNQLQINLL